jgi:hypothetical protein
MPYRFLQESLQQPGDRDCAADQVAAVFYCPMDSGHQGLARPLKCNLREQLVDMLGGDIIRGRLQPGDLLPSEDGLVSRYGVSRTVTARGTERTVGEGLNRCASKAWHHGAAQVGMEPA